MNDLSSNLEQQPYATPQDKTEVAAWNRTAQEIIPHPMAVFYPDPTRPGRIGKAEIVSGDKLPRLKRPNGELIDEDELPLILREPARWIVMSDYRVFPIGQVIEKDLLDQVRSRLKEVIIRNWQNTHFEGSEEEKELLVKLLGYRNFAEEKGEKLEAWKEVSLEGRTRSKHLELETPDRRVIWIDINIEHEESSGPKEERWKRGDIWYLSPVQEPSKVKRDIFHTVQEGRNVRISTIITVDRTYQLGIEQINPEKHRVWFRFASKIPDPPHDFRKQTGMRDWTTGHDVETGKIYPPNVYIVDQTLEFLRQGIQKEEPSRGFKSQGEGPTSGQQAYLDFMASRKS